LRDENRLAKTVETRETKESPTDEKKVSEDRGKPGETQTEQAFRPGYMRGADKRRKKRNSQDEQLSRDMNVKKNVAETTRSKESKKQ